MENIKTLFANLPKYGWGNSIEFTGSESDFDQAKRVLTGNAEMDLVWKRAYYLRNLPKDETELPFPEWVKQFMENDNYTTYMLKNYSFINGSFVLPEDIDLNQLAGVALSYDLI